MVLAASGALTCGVSTGVRAETVHRAAVIVEGDGQTRRVVVEFPEESITGIELLRRAGADPVVYSYSGVGGAVCRLYGVGRDAGPDCLGGTGGDARYWAYFRAPAGSTSFRYAAVGGGSSTVRDGDVEGWRYGTGAAPAFASIDAILGIAPTPTVLPPTGVVAPPSTAGATPGTPGGPPGAVPGTPGPAIPDPSGPPIAETSGVTDEPGGLVNGPLLAADPAVARRGAPTGAPTRGPRSLALLALGLGGIGAAFAWVRRSRRAAGAR